MFVEPDERFDGKREGEPNCEILGGYVCQYPLYNTFKMDEHIEAFEYAFRMFERMRGTPNGGVVYTSDLFKIMSACGVSCSENDRLVALDKIDPEGRGILNFQQFVEFVSNFALGIITEEEILEAFRCFDRDASGSLDSKELKHILQTMGDKLSEEEADMMVLEADKDGDGDIDYGEFVKVILDNQ
mmetsp:Transcript_6279/g.13572  ORF Transcript_6279/g.13572 Transcript_6279/m.13572 type:complete len:186 (+) Transcript_6279:41-598(+)